MPRRSGNASAARATRPQGSSASDGVDPAGILPDMEPSTSGLVVAIDGPGSSGKSSVGAAAALRVGYRFCDTGLLYRAVTWLALARVLPATDHEAISALVDEVELAPDEVGRLAHVKVDDVDHTADVRGPGGPYRVTAWTTATSTSPGWAGSTRVSPGQTAACSGSGR